MTKTSEDRARDRIFKIFDKKIKPYLILGANLPNIREALLEAIDQAVKEEREACAVIVEKVWKEAPNTRESGFRQNQISHGCIASAKAIRARNE